MRSGQNVATLTLSGTGSVEIDKIEMLGSWSIVSGDNGAFSHEGGLQGKDYYIGDRNLTHVTRAVTSSQPRNRIHFYLPAYLAENFPFEFSFRTDGNSGGSSEFAIDVNGTQVFHAPNGLVGGERTLTLDPGLLVPGWNVIEPRYLAGGGAWVQFTRYTLKMIAPDFGTVLMLR